MSQASRPMQIALLAVVAFAAVWFVALRPKPEGDVKPASAPNAPGVAGLRRAVGKAHGAVGAANAQARQAQGLGADAPGRGTATKAGSAVAAGQGGARVAPYGHPRTAGAARVNRALAQHRTLAVLFYNSKSYDDRAVRRTLDRADRHLGRVVVVEAPISDLSDYAALNAKAVVTMSPTLAIVDGQGNMKVLTGFVDGVQLQQALLDVLGLDGPGPGHLLHTAPLSLEEYHHRAKAWCRRTRESFRESLSASTASMAPDELAPALHNSNEIAANDVAAFTSITPPRRLLAAQRAVVAADYSFLRTARRFERAVARSRNSVRTEVARIPAYRDEVRAIAGRASAPGRKLGLGRCA